MFSRPTAFSPLVTQFDQKLIQLTWNDGTIIHELTALAKLAPPSDVDVLTACVVFRIIMNPSKSKLPVIYLMDSITKNSGPLYGEAFSKYLYELYPSIYQVIGLPDLRAYLQKLVTAWVNRSAFHTSLISGIQAKMEEYDKINAQVPPVSGWPLVLPAGSESLPGFEISIVQYLYKNVMPLVSPTMDQIQYNKDAIVTLAKLLRPLDAKLCRPHDDEIDNLLAQYDQLVILRTKIQNEPPTNGFENNMPFPAPSTSSLESLTYVPIQPEQEVVAAPPPVRKMDTEPGTRPTSSKPSISYPRSLSSYYQPSIDMLYKNLTHKCTTCGLRFKTSEELLEHYDGHYFERSTHLGRQSGRGGKLQRQWYISTSEWVQTNGGTTGQVTQETPTHTSKEGDGEVQTEKKIVRIRDEEHETRAICAACGDDIDQPEFDDSPTSAGWFYPNAVRGADGKLYHANCAPEPAIALNASTSLLNNSTEQKKRPHADDEVFDELMVSPNAKKPKVEEVV